MVIHNPLTRLALTITFAISTQLSAAQPLTETDVGEFDYMIHCQGCHQADGSGTPGATPDLRSYGTALLRTVEGRQYFVRVPGSRNAPITDLQLARVLNHIIDDILADPSGQVEPLQRFDEAEVAAYRPTAIDNVDLLRATLLQQVSTGIGLQLVSQGR
ncbi:MAG: hypothetical protein AAGF57_19320 [Pseudomonadota bacterium]